MKAKILFLFIQAPMLLLSQSMVLKGHLINEKTLEPISDAKVYILGGDSEDQTTTFGEYRLNLELGGPYEVGDYVDVYIKHEVFGFHKVAIPILKDLKQDIKIKPDNIVKISGTVLDNDTKEPIKNIEVTIISEENLNLSGDDLLITTSDKYGGYSFLISKSLIGNQRYAKLKFFDPNDTGYRFKEDVINITSHQSIFLEKRIIENIERIDLSGKPYEAKTSGLNPIKLEPIETNEYGTIEFNSGRGVKRHEFKSSPNKNEIGKAIESGVKVKVLGRKKSGGIDWCEIEYNGQIGWIEARYIY